MPWEELVGVQEFALGRDLVTYWTTSWLVSSNPDWPFATGAPVPRYRGRGNDRGSLACLTSGGGFRRCAQRGTPVWGSTADAIGSEGWDRITLYNAGTHVDTGWAPARMILKRLGRQTRDFKTRVTPEQNRENKRTKL